MGRPNPSLLFLKYTSGGKGIRIPLPLRESVRHGTHVVTGDYDPFFHQLLQSNVLKNKDLRVVCGV